MERRRFLRFVAAVPVATLGACKSRPVRRAPKVPDAGVGPSCSKVGRRSAKTGRLLDRVEWETIEAACSRILPTDEDPGAAEAEVVNYIDAQLQHPPLAAFRPLFRAGSRFLTARARPHGVRSFAELPGHKQDLVLRQLQRGRMGRFSGQRFFRVLLAMTLEGFLGDPVYGGNRDGVGWKMIGFTPQQPGPRCPYVGGA